jgi:hypothetical protein
LQVIATTPPGFGIDRAELESLLPYLDGLAGLAKEARCTPPTTSAPGLGSPRQHLRRDWAYPTQVPFRTESEDKCVSYLHVLRTKLATMTEGEFVLVPAGYATWCIAARPRVPTSTATQSTHK